MSTNSKGKNALLITLLVLACLLCAGIFFGVIGFVVFRNLSQVTPRTHHTTEETTDETEHTNITNAPVDPNAPEWTVMIYMCGTNLETEHGIASMVLDGMNDFKNSDDVNIIVQTGGTAKWNNKDNYFRGDAVQKINIPNDKLGRYKIEHNNIIDLGAAPLESMGSDETLSDFISWTAENYPAKKYIFLFWDHGYVEPYGCMMNDELFCLDSNGKLISTRDARGDDNYVADHLSLTEVRKGFEDGGVHFDLVIYNTCLAASYEIASATAPYADYMVASQESIPAVIGIPLEYLNYIIKDPTVTAPDIGNKILSLYSDALRQNSNRYGSTYTKAFDLGTMSFIDLSIMTEMDKYMGQIWEQIYYSGFSLNDYTTVVSACAECENYGSEGNAPGNLIDLLTFLRRASGALQNTDADEKAFELIRKNVKSISGDGRTDSNGMSMFFPSNDYVQALRNTIIARYDRAGATYDEKVITDMCKYVIDMSFDGYVDNIDEIDGYYWYAEFLHNKFKEYWDGNPDAQALAIKNKDSNHTGSNPVSKNIPIEYTLNYDVDGHFTLEITKGLEGVVSVETNIVDLMEFPDDDYRVYTYFGSENLEADKNNSAVFNYFYEFDWIVYDDITVPVFIIEHNENYTLYAMSAEVNGEWMYVIFRQTKGSGDYELLYAIDADDQSGLASTVHYQIKDGDTVSPIYYSVFFGYYYAKDGTSHVRTFYDKVYDSSTSGFRRRVMYGNMSKDAKILVNFIIKDSFGNSTYTDSVMLVIDKDTKHVKQVVGPDDLNLDPYTSLYAVTSES